VLVHRDRDVEERRADGLCQQWPVALVGRVEDEGDAAGNSSGRVVSISTGPVRPVEPQPVVRPRPLPVLELGLRDGRAEADVHNVGASAV